MTMQTDKRLGSILTNLKLLSESELAEALLVRKQTGLPLGSVLLMSSYITERELRAVIQAQSMLKDELVSDEQIDQAIEIVRYQPVSFEGALRQFGWLRDGELKSNKLGELLLSARLLSHLQLARGLVTSRLTMLPLGRTLVLTDAISQRMLKQALAMQEKIRLKQFKRAEGILFLRDLCLRNDLIAKHHRFILSRGSMTEPLILGDLLIESELLSEGAFLNALEQSVLQQRLIGEWLVERRLVELPILKAALDLQRLVALSVISRSQAIAALSTMNEDSVELKSALEQELPVNTVNRLLSKEAVAIMTSHLTGLAVADIFHELADSGKGNLLTMGVDFAGTAGVFHDINRPTGVRAIAKELCAYVFNGSLKVDQAIVVLNVCMNDECTIPTALKKLTWIVNVPAHKHERFTRVTRVSCSPVPIGV